MVAVSASAALAGVVEDRQALMKGFGDASRNLLIMSKGTTPYDAATAKAQMKILADGAPKISGLFPAGSDTDPKTLALPTVSSDKPGFDAAAARSWWRTPGAAMATTDQAGFMAGYDAVHADCGACHMTYRHPLPPGAGPAPLPKS